MFIIKAASIELLFVCLFVFLVFLLLFRLLWELDLSLKLSRFLFVCLDFFFFGKYLNTSILLSMVQHIPMLEKCRSTEKPLQTDVTGVLYF